MMQKRFFLLYLYLTTCGIFYEVLYYMHFGISYTTYMSSVDLLRLMTNTIIFLAGGILAASLVSYGFRGMAKLLKFEWVCTILGSSLATYAIAVSVVKILENSFSLYILLMFIPLGAMVQVATEKRKALIDFRTDKDNSLNTLIHNKDSVMALLMIPMFFGLLGYNFAWIQEETGEKICSIEECLPITYVGRVGETYFGINETGSIYMISGVDTVIINKKNIIFPEDKIMEVARDNVDG